jgi:hypothetical protein
MKHKRLFGVMFHKRGFVFDQIYQQRQQQRKKDKAGMAQYRPHFVPGVGWCAWHVHFTTFSLSYPAF